MKAFKENYVLDSNLPMTIVTSDCEKDGDWLESAIRKEPGCADLTIIRGAVGPTIGAHVGPGMVAVIFWGKNRADKASLTDRIAKKVRRVRAFVALRLALQSLVGALRRPPSSFRAIRSTTEPLTG